MEKRIILGGKNEVFEEFSGMISRGNFIPCLKTGIFLEKEKVKKHEMVHISKKGGSKKFGVKTQNPYL
ncbi:hypothetical protein EBI_25509, partial [Enterocytozoon bieneusi H348]